MADFIWRFMLSDGNICLYFLAKFRPSSEFCQCLLKLELLCMCYTDVLYFHYNQGYSV